MADLATNQVVDAGTAPAAVAASASDTVEVGNGRNVLVEYFNSSGSPVDITFAAVGTTDYGDDLPDHVVTVPANGSVLVPVRKDYSDAGRATVTTAGSASLTVRVFKVA
jgi:hypothetical protein